MERLSLQLDWCHHIAYWLIVAGITISLHLVGLTTFKIKLRSAYKIYLSLVSESSSRINHLWTLTFKGCWTAMIIFHLLLLNKEEKYTISSDGHVDFVPAASYYIMAILWTQFLTTSFARAQMVSTCELYNGTYMEPVSQVQIQHHGFLWNITTGVSLVGLMLLTFEFDYDEAGNLISSGGALMMVSRFTFNVVWQALCRRDATWIRNLSIAPEILHLTGLAFLVGKDRFFQSGGQLVLDPMIRVTTISRLFLWAHSETFITLVATSFNFAMEMTWASYTGPRVNVSDTERLEVERWLKEHKLWREKGMKLISECPQG